MSNIIEGDAMAGGVRLAIAVARFNSFITDRLLQGALDTIRQHGGDADAATVVKVPGSFELPLVAKKLGASGKFDAVICLGCVIQGDTAHYGCVVQGAASGIQQAGLDTGVPTIFGVLTCSNHEQALDRAGGKMGNAGASAALAAIEMAGVMRKMGQKPEARGQ